ncbi:RidA family protein [Burkholderiaceae bacterium]|jgi:enamine deaminase RidA (YjgF/YER057c/UK114 family)|nr:RidA family protein [Betaproteobacteria bacterium]MDA8600551.1 RidA family protein [Burkholderiaceae bacterium]MCH9846290.1 RidA family protein [Betaproteobacteria bacterium]MDA9076178.1 RidA family protein [Burkholderiaceae bacterium]MDA9885562.1 RidA family protein [Burkholderiaceae bacterium]
MTTITRLHTQTRMSKTVIHGDTIYLCGQTSGGSEASTMAEQTQEALSRVDTLLAEVGSSKAHLLSALIHINDMADFAEMNAVWDAWLPEGCAPARTTVQAALARPELRFEVTVVAGKP